MVIRLLRVIYSNQQVSEFDQEMPQSQTADQPNAWKEW